MRINVDMHMVGEHKIADLASYSQQNLGGDRKVPELSAFCLVVKALQVDDNTGQWLLHSGTLILYLERDSQ